MNSQLKKATAVFLSKLAKARPGVFSSLLKQGDLVEGEVIEKSSRIMLVDLGPHGVGAVYGGEMKNAREMIRGLKEGDKVNAKVVDVDNEDGFVELSLTEADKQKSWTMAAEAQELGEPIKVKISGFNKGGLMADVYGLKAFLPVSQLAPENYPNVTDGDKTKIAAALQEFVGKEFSVKILDVKPNAEKLILSEREAREISNKELVKDYKEGQIIDGVVSGVADFGVFVKFTDNPSVEGIMHTSELSHRAAVNPKELVKIDMPVQAKIIEIKDDKIYLSLKALQANPWDNVAERYKEGQEVKGKVYNFSPFGAVISLDEEIQGQIHVAEFGSVEEMKKLLKSDEEYGFVITEVNPSAKRITLKLK